MNKDMGKIIKLSDCKWIQERWKPCIGDWTSNKDKDLIAVVNPRTKLDGLKEVAIWLPVGFNPENCRLQIDDLLMEALEFVQSNECILRDEFIEWLKEDNTIKSTIILKLEWLRELIGKEV